jgi:tripartite-type tricarboxylate transporter receptor subunit TctC
MRRRRLLLDAPALLPAMTMTVPMTLALALTPAWAQRAAPGTPAVAGGAGTAAGTAWPAQPIKLLIGFAPGGAVDAIARAVQDGLEAALGQPLVVEYLPGAGVAAAEVARAAPDGYTLLVATTGPFAIAPHLQPRLPYEPAKQFTYIAQIAEANYIVAVRNNHPARDLRQFVEWARSFDGPLSYASSGVATASHLNGELLNSVTGVELRHVPYGSGASAMTDVIGGRVQVFIEAGSTVLPEVRRGRLRALAVTGARRDTNLPTVPTVAEQGWPGLQSVGFQGLVGPAGLPEAIVLRLGSELVKVLAQPDVKKRLHDAGSEAQPRDAQQFAAIVRSESERWAALVARRGLARAP